MRTYWTWLKRIWLTLLQAPWGSGRIFIDDKSVHWLLWLLFWAYGVSGMVLGALIAPALAQMTGLAGTSYQDWLVIAVAVLVGFFVQALVVALVSAINRLSDVVSGHSSLITARSERVESLSTLVIVIVVLLPFPSIGYGIYHYLSWVGAGQRTVTVAFVGALLIKTFAIPLIKGIVTGVLFRWFMKWLRGGKDTKKAT